MKIVEITSNIKVAITNEEADLLTKFDDETPVVAKRELDERQQLLANQLVNKDVLQRKNENGRIIYKKRTG
jgi:hypothetical protein